MLNGAAPSSAVLQLLQRADIEIAIHEFVGVVVGEAVGVFAPDMTESAEVPFGWTTRSADGEDAECDGLQVRPLSAMQLKPVLRTEGSDVVEQRRVGVVFERRELSERAPLRCMAVVVKNLMMAFKPFMTAALSKMLALWYSGLRA